MSRIAYLQRPVAEYVLYSLMLAFNFLAPRAFVSIGGWEVYVSAIFMGGALIILPPPTPHRNPQRNLVITSFLILLILGVFSLAWGQSSYHTYYRIAPLLNAGLTVLVAKRIAQGLIRVDIKRVLHNVSFLLVGATLLRALRDAATLTGEWSRLETQMGGASVLHLPLLIALAFYFYCVHIGYRLWRSVGLVSVIVILIFMTGSRAGVVSMALLVGLLVARLVRAKFVLPTILGLGALTYFAFLRLPTDRLLDFEDSLRSVNTESALNAAFESTTSTLIGQGIGSLWPWYYRLAAGTEEDLFITRHGLFLRNPHSTPLGVLAELGLLGAALLLLTLVPIAYVGVRHYVRRPASLAGTVGIAVAVSMASFFAEYHLFSNFTIAFFWWFHALLLFELQSGQLQTDASERNTS